MPLKFCALYVSCNPIVNVYRRSLLCICFVRVSFVLTIGHKISPSTSTSSDIFCCVFNLCVSTFVARCVGETPANIVPTKECDCWVLPFATVTVDCCIRLTASQLSSADVASPNTYYHLVVLYHSLIIVVSFPTTNNRSLADPHTWSLTHWYNQCQCVKARSFLIGYRCPWPVVDCCIRTDTAHTDCQLPPIFLHNKMPPFDCCVLYCNPRPLPHCSVHHINN